MAPHVRVSQLKQYVGQEVTVKGWLYGTRSSGKLVFMQVRDGSGIVQTVMFKNDFSPELFAQCDKLPNESSLIVTGQVKADERAPGGVEMSLKDVKIVGVAEPYPIANQSDQGVDHLMSNRHLWLRSRVQHAQLRVRAMVVKSIRDFFDQNGFLLVDAPIFTPAACEGTTTLFEVKYFDDKAYMTQSGQLYMEAAAMAHGRVYCFGPTFRAEKSKTRRHLTEFWMVEPEIAYCEFDELMEWMEKLVSYIVAQCLEHRREELTFLERDLSKLANVKPPFPRIAYSECVKQMHDAGHPFEDGNDFGAPDEAFVADKYDRPVLVHRFPAQVKAFYMKADPNDPTYALGADMLAPEGYGEIIGGGQRAEDLKYLEDKIAEHKLPKEAFEWYLDLRRYGSVPHSGFGLGVERTTAWICGTKHIRECIPFPRMLYKIYP